MSDVREKYEALTARRDQAKQKWLEAQANLKALETREEELGREAAALGVSDLSKLDDSITSLEQEIELELQAVADELDLIESGKQQPSPTTLVEGETATPSTHIELDDLLTEGGQADRRTP